MKDEAPVSKRLTSPDIEPAKEPVQFSFDGGSVEGFEGESLAAHVNACEQERLPCTVLDLAGFALDLDRPEDIETLLDAAQDLQTTRLLRHWFAGDLRNSTAA